MARSQTRFVCQQCGYESPRWLGRCPECEAWSSFSEEIRVPSKSRSPSTRNVAAGNPPIPITDVAAAPLPRFSSGISELDRVLGGGIVPGALVLVGGDPGIGKSTLLTQVASLVPAALYISGEESVQQIRLRSERLGAKSENLLVVNETELSAILHPVAETHPADRV